MSPIPGLEVPSQHETVLLTFGGKKTQLNVSNLAAIAESYVFKPMVIDTPKIFSEDVRRYRRSNKKGFQFMQNEISDLLMRAQVFVVKDQKRRIVIDYSITVNLLNNVDPYLFPNMHKLLN